jgi:hypothetical protein
MVGHQERSSRVTWTDRFRPGFPLGIEFMLFSCACLFVHAQVMFEYREEELRQGIQRKC